MTTIAAAVEDYIGVRRSLGYKLPAHPGLLGSFVAHLEATGLETVTTEAALAWATTPSGTSLAWHAKRLEIVRGFAVWLHALDARCEVPPRGLLANRPCRAEPWLYSDDDVAALMAQARLLVPRLRAATYETVLGLLAATGLRPGEVMHLDRDDVDLGAGALRVMHSKFDHCRELPLHPSTVDVLRGYENERDELCPQPSGPSFFVAATGARLGQCALNQTFVRLRQGAGLEPATGSPRRPPRMMDFRHSFAMRTMLGWYRDGADVGALLPSLSTYLGHADPAAIYWYLSATPELLALAAARADRHQRRSR